MNFARKSSLGYQKPHEGRAPSAVPSCRCIELGPNNCPVLPTLSFALSSVAKKPFCEFEIVKKFVLVSDWLMPTRCIANRLGFSKRTSTGLHRSAIAWCCNPYWPFRLNAAVFFPPRFWLFFLLLACNLWRWAPSLVNHPRAHSPARNCCAIGFRLESDEIFFCILLDFVWVLHVFSCVSFFAWMFFKTLRRHQVTPIINVLYPTFFPADHARNNQDSFLICPMINSKTVNAFAPCSEPF